MAFDKQIDKIIFSGSKDNLKYEESELPMMYFLDQPTISNGTCSISVPEKDTGYLLVGIRVNDKESFGITYEAYYVQNIS